KPGSAEKPGGAEKPGSAPASGGDRHGGEWRPGVRVAVTVRPEHVAIAAAGEGPPGPPGTEQPGGESTVYPPAGTEQAAGEPAVNVFSGVVAKAVYKGGVIHYRVFVGNDTISAIERSDRRFVEGEQVRVTLAADKLWILA
ncbi:MAG: TOBE domain-containing protein, partial [Spirochaetia bacterium]